MAIQRITEEIKNDENLFLNLFDQNIIQQIFIQLSNSHEFYEDIKECYSDCNSFCLTSKLFNCISKQTQFSIKIFQTEEIENINYSIHLKLHYILQQDNIKNKTFNSKEEILNQILMYVSKYGIYNLIQPLISNGANPNYEEVNYGNFTPLCHSCFNGHYQTTKLLIFNNSNIHHKTKHTETTPLFYSCYSGNLDLVKYLINNGADVYTRSNSRETLLFPAASSENLNLLKYLINEKKLNINIETSQEETVLFHACESGNLDMVEYLVKEKRADTYLENYDSRTILFSAVDSENTELTDFLIFQDDLDINETDRHGQSPLFIACGDCNLEMTQHLISIGADVTIKDKENKTVLDVAKDTENQDMIQEIQQYI